MCAAFSVAALLGAVLWENATTTTFGELAVVLCLAMALCLMGLVDDLRGIGPGVRFMIEIAAAAVLFWQGIGVSISKSGPVDLALTIVWVVGITNALNLLDNMDGLSSGVAAIAAGSFFVIAALEGQFLVALLAVALAGCALGFLRHNFQPARIYMGDAGSLFLGFMLAYLGVALRFDDVTTDITVFVPILVLTVPILDTTLVVISRIANGRNPLSGGRDHISHRLLRLGLSVRSAVGLIYVAAGATGAIALLVVRLTVPTAWIVSGVVGLAALIAGSLLARVPVDEGRAEDRDAPTAVTRLGDRRRRGAA
jgi:UDP-GlcNAc:undecaprenyl-phosphate GlcNAc-1-phosphate transferase